MQITRQHYRGRRWHVVHDPSSNQFYRLSAVANEFVGLFDGRRSVEEIWKQQLSRRGDEALTQNEVINLLSQLYGSNLIAGDINPETDALLRRGRERRGKKLRQQAIGLMYFKLRLFNPDRLLSAIEPVMRPMLSLWGLAVWAVLLAVALTSVLPEWEKLASGVGSAVAPSNWGWMIVTFVVLKLIHETGHGVLVKRFGGQVPEFGVMLLVLLPAPYVDASAAWTLPSKWKRIAVGAGGMIFELFVAAIAALAWKATLDQPGSLVHQLSYNAMLTASVSTVLFNINPLMKFDGYYMLSDLIEVPNLMPRSFKLLQFLVQKHAYRLRDPQSPTTDPGEAALLFVYAWGALAYRIFLFISITLYVMGIMFGIGLILAIWTAAMWFVMPVGKFVHWLATSPQLHDHRRRTIVVSLAMAAAGLALIGVVPAPDNRRAVGVVESRARSGVFIKTDGIVEAVHVRPGSAVRAGEAILTARSPELEAQLRLLRAQRAEFASREDAAATRDVAEAQVARAYVAAMDDQIATLEEKAAGLVVRSPRDGVIAGDDPRRMVGALAREGEPVCVVVDADDVRVTATIAQTEGSWLFDLPTEAYRVEVRRASRVQEAIPAVVEAVLPAGQRELPHPALGFAGGGKVETEAGDQSGTVTKRPMFEARFASADGAVVGLPGERVHLRFELPSRPLLAQWVDSLRKLTQGRAKL